MGLLWDCSGIAPGLLWYCCEIAVGLLWDCCGIAVALLWDCCGIAVGLLWDYRRGCIVLHRGCIMLHRGCIIWSGLVWFSLVCSDLREGSVRHSPTCFEASQI